MTNAYDPHLLVHRNDLIRDQIPCFPEHDDQYIPDTCELSAGPGFRVRLHELEDRLQLMIEQEVQRGDVCAMIETTARSAPGPASTSWGT